MIWAPIVDTQEENAPQLGRKPTTLPKVNATTVSKEKLGPLPKDLSMQLPIADEGSTMDYTLV